MAETQTTPSLHEPSQRSLTIALGVIAFAGWLLRIIAFVRAGGPLAYTIDYDEGVYFSSSALLVKGTLPYRDFVLVHPPGLLIFLSPFSALAGPVDVADAFAASRFFMSLVGAANIFLVGKIALRWAGPTAALVSAALYATYPEVMIVERGPFLEPALNLFCLAMAYFWLEEGTIGANRTRNAYLAGAFCGLACATKLIGGIWLFAALLSLPKERRSLHAIRFLATAALTGLALVVPFAFIAPKAFFTQLLLFHATRPPDGVLGWLPRLKQMVLAPHLVTILLVAISAIAGCASRAIREQRSFRLFAFTWALTTLVFLRSVTYFDQYNSHLAVSEVMLAGFGANLAFNRIRVLFRGRFATRSLPLAVIVALIAASPYLGRPTRLGRAPGQLPLGDAVRHLTKPEDCLFAFEPTYAVLGGRLPQSLPPAPLIVDTYGAMLLDATSDGSRFNTADEAFRANRSQNGARTALESCRFVVLGPRGEWQFALSMDWFKSRFTKRFPNEGSSGIDVWEKNE
jgi:hypothetical protein